MLDVLLSHVAVFPEGTYSFVYNSCNQPCVLTVVCTDCDTEDYGLEILFLECWSRASELDFFEVQYITQYIPI